ncbi:hypothetical protein BDZ91DRAFT_714079 [Kalaharituber pfeilii]|nr:hypothetical protein BDZ91DRAFT_714079 [Kalaharituber pfeilii]
MEDTCSRAAWDHEFYCFLRYQCVHLDMRAGRCVRCFLKKHESCTMLYLIYLVNSACMCGSWTHWRSFHSE